MSKYRANEENLPLRQIVTHQKAIVIVYDLQNNDEVVKEQIIDYAASTGADLIVLGAQHKPFSDSTVIGTTTVNVTRHAPCPVLTVIRK